MEHSGAYSVQTAYITLLGSQTQNNSNFFKSFWCKLTPFKISSFAWKSLMNTIPIIQNLLHKKIIPPSSNSFCPLCNSALESTEHLLLNCHFVFKIWSKCYSWWGIKSVFPRSMKDHLVQHSNLFVHKNLSMAWRMIWFATLWYTWKHRNDIIFRNSRPDADDV